MTIKLFHRVTHLSIDAGIILFEHKIRLDMRTYYKLAKNRMHTLSLWYLKSYLLLW